MNSEILNPTAKCHCSNCNQHLEFERSRLGETILCPHCEVETVLFLPGDDGRVYRVETSSRVKKRRWKIIAAVAALALVIGLIAWLGAKLIEPAFAGLQIAGSVLLIVILTSVLVFLIWTAILWAFFPVVVYLGMSHIERLLWKIERKLPAAGEA